MEYTVVIVIMMRDIHTDDDFLKEILCEQKRR